MCRQPCLKAMPCGHVCPNRCHVSDPEHDLVACAVRVVAQCPAGHVMEAACSAACGRTTMPTCATCKEIARSAGEEKARAEEEQKQHAQLVEKLAVAKAEAEAKRQKLVALHAAQLELTTRELEVRFIACTLYYPAF